MFNEATIGVMLFSLVHRDRPSRNIELFPIGYVSLIRKTACLNLGFKFVDSNKKNFRPDQKNRRS